MRGWFSLWITLLLLSAARADTTWVAAGAVSGAWDAEHSPYMIQGHVAVPAGETLTIGPGVRVYFDGPYHFAVDTGAAFNAVGAAGDSIVFTTDTLAHPERWRGLRIYAALDTVRLIYFVMEHVGYEEHPSLERGSIARQSTLRLEHSALRSNRGMNEGGALNLNTCQADFRHCELIGNYGGNGGGGFLRNTPARFEDCRFEDNFATGGGGVFDIWDSQPGDTVYFTDCAFRRNRSSNEGFSGGAIMNEISRLVFKRCRFEYNAAPHGGAVTYFGNPYARFVDCRFTGNSATGNGGAINATGTLVLLHCVLDSNTALDGGAVRLGGLPSATPSLIDHCTFAGNSAGPASATLALPEGNGFNGRLRNSIFASCLTGAAIAYPGGGVSMPRFCNFFDNPAGDFDHPGANSYLGMIDCANWNGDPCDCPGNIYVNPGFVDMAAGDYHLRGTSPCINAGDTTQLWDDDGTPPEIGAFPGTSSAVPPAAFALALPRDEAVLGGAVPVRFAWYPSADPDPDDIVDYELHLTVDQTHLTYSAILDTFFDVGAEIQLLPEDIWITWWVTAHSAHPNATTPCEASFRFQFDRTPNAAGDPASLPAEVALHAAYPNPFNARAVLAYDLPRAAEVSLVVYNLLGEAVAELAQGSRPAGRHQALWQADGVASGAYVAVLTTGERCLRQKLLLLK